MSFFGVLKLQIWQHSYLLLLNYTFSTFSTVSSGTVLSCPKKEESQTLFSFSPTILSRKLSNKTEYNFFFFFNIRTCHLALARSPLKNAKLFGILQSTLKKSAESTVSLVKSNSLWLNITATDMAFHIQKQISLLFLSKEVI